MCGDAKVCVMPRPDGATLRAWRLSRHWAVPEMARQVRRAAGDTHIAEPDALKAMIHKWERDAVDISERYMLLYCRVLGVTPERLVSGPRQQDPPEPARTPIPGSHLGRPIEALTAVQLEELMILLDDQWHALVRADNLLGPRHALGGVRGQLGVIEALARTVRPPLRAEVLKLGARYAESAAWLHEDSGDMPGAGHWTGRAMEWALEAGDRLMTSWALFRRGEHAAARGDAAAAAGLAGAARREGGQLPDRMVAAILLQEARAHALDGAEAACHLALGQAHELAAAPDDPGDASRGHASFCTPGYVEMQRGRCWLRLGHPAKALSAFNRAAVSLPPIYRRDRGVAISGRAAAFAALREPAEAATAAAEALGIACGTGSERIVRMVMPVAESVASHNPQLQVLLAEYKGV
jgi:tetratricopeptide (TPR) repeat protein